jgi:DNA-binding IclR family transcriptional regulator
MRRERDQPWIEAAVAARGQPDGTQSIHRSFLVLRVVAAGGDRGVGLSEVARASALARPTCRRLLMALMAEGIVEQRLRTRRYVVAPYVQFPAARPASTPLIDAALPQLKEAAAEIGDTVFLTLRTGLETVCVARVLGSYPIQVLTLDVGVRRPLGMSSSGIAFLATMPMDVARKIVIKNKRHLPAYGMTLEDSLKAIERARSMGFALRDPGLVPGTKAISLAFGRGRGGAPAALTVAAIARRMQPARVGDLVKRLNGYASKILKSASSEKSPTSRGTEAA